MYQKFDYETLKADCASHIMRGARLDNMRTGQWLFNHLPIPVGRYVSGTLFDPFHRDLSEQEVYEWIDNHLIFDGYVIVGVFDGNNIIWDANNG